MGNGILFPRLFISIQKIWRSHVQSMIVTLTKKRFHSFPPVRIFPIRNIPLVPFVRDGSNDSWKYNFTSNNLLTIIPSSLNTRARGGIIYVRVHVFGKKGMKRHEKKGWLGAYYEQRARGTCVPSIFHVHPCNKKIYTSLEKMGCRRCDVWILVQCRASGMHEQTWRRAAPENENR